MNEILCPWCQCPDFEAHYMTGILLGWTCNMCGEKPDAETSEMLDEQAWDRYYMVDMEGYNEQ